MTNLERRVRELTEEKNILTARITSLESTHRQEPPHSSYEAQRTGGQQQSSGQQVHSNPGTGCCHNQSQTPNIVISPHFGNIGLPSSPHLAPMPTTNHPYAMQMPPVYPQMPPIYPQPYTHTYTPHYQRWNMPGMQNFWTGQPVHYQQQHRTPNMQQRNSSGLDQQRHNPKPATGTQPQDSSMGSTTLNSNHTPETGPHVHNTVTPPNQDQQR